MGDFDLGNVVLIDTSTNAIVKTITVGGQPYILATSSDGDQIFVTDFYSGSACSIIDTTSETKIGTLVTPATVFNEANLIPSGAITSDSVSLLLPSRLTNKLFRVNTLDNSVAAIITPTITFLSSDNTDVVINSSDTKAYALFTDNVFSIDLSDNSSSSGITVGTTPKNLAFTTDDAFVYVTNYGSDSVSVIDTSTDTVSATISSINQPNYIVMNPVLAEAYVTDEFNDEIAVINTSTHSIITTIPLGGQPGTLAVDSTGSLLYAVDAGTVSVINTSTRTIIDTITPASSATAVAVAPDNSSLYVGVGTSIAIYDIPGYALNSTVTSANSANRLLLDSLGTNLYIFSNTGNVVRIMDTSSEVITGAVGRDTTIGVAEFGATSGGGGSAISPINVEGVAKKSGFINQTVLKNEISWFAPYNTTSSTVLRYRVYRDGRAVGVVDAGASLVYVDRDVRGGREYTYEIRAEGSSSSNLTSGSVNVRTKKAR